MDEQDEKLFEDVIKLIPSFLFPKDKPISGKLCLEKDLGIYGDDAEDFLFKCGKKYNVDLSNFNFGKYFTKETWFIFYGKSFQKKPKYDLTIEDLVQSIKKGKLE